MTKDKAYEAWVDSDPPARTAHPAFMAGWEARGLNCLKWDDLPEAWVGNLDFFQGAIWAQSKIIEKS
jgi:hypothetical protein